MNVGAGIGNPSVDELVAMLLYDEPLQSLEYAFADHSRMTLVVVRAKPIGTRRVSQL